jgi:hypothetical protein
MPHVPLCSYIPAVLYRPMYLILSDTYVMHKFNAKCEVGSHSFFIYMEERWSRYIYSGQSIIHVCEGGQSIHFALDVCS